MLETQNLTVRFGGHVAVSAVSCAFAPGTLTAIVGPNGAGKSTLLHAIGGYYPATAGEILLAGEALAGIADHLDRVVRAGKFDTWRWQIIGVHWLLAS